MIKKLLFITFIIISVLVSSHNTLAQDDDSGSQQDTTITKKETRRVNRIEARKNMKQHLTVSINTTYAYLETQLRFITPKGLLSFQLGLENNLRLPDKRWLVSGNIIYRITPRSGLFGMYYGLKRNSNFQLQDDIILPGDTIFAGTGGSLYFQTDVYSFGYLFTILETKKTFLAAFINMYMMNIKAGIKVNPYDRNYSYQFLAPLPNLGLIMDFRLKRWLELYGGFGIFFINNIDGFSSTIHDFYFYTSFKPVKWLGISVGYRVFDVSVIEHIDDGYRLDISYNFQGPSAALYFKF